MIERLRAFDDRLYRIEKAVVAGILAVMGVVVFLDVVHRVSTRTGSWIANPLVVAVVSAVIAVLAFRTRGADNALLKGVGVGVGIAAAQALFIRIVPNGLVWSQPLALALTLWLGTIGASLAAHERRHLALDIGHRLWPPAMAPKVAAVGHWLTAAFCVLVLFLAVGSVAAHYDLWSATDGAAGNLSGATAIVAGRRVMIPTWLAALSIPYGMTVLAFRFTFEGVRVWTGSLSVEVDELAQLGIQVPHDEAAR